MGQRLFDIFLNLLGQCFIRCVAIMEYDIGLGFDEVLGIRRSHDSAFQHHGVLHDTGFHLHRRYPDASHLEHVVGTPHVEKVAVRVAEELVIRPVDPEL